MNLTSCNSTKKLHKHGDAQSPLFDNSFWSLACVPGKVSHKYGPLIKSLRRDEGEKGKQAVGKSGSAGEALSLSGKAKSAPDTDRHVMNFSR